jgi:phosphoserine phosphatase
MVSDSRADMPLYNLAELKFAVSPKGKLYKGLPKRNI